MQDRYFSPDPGRRSLARELYAPIAGAPLVCPHGHVDPRLFADPDADFGTPVDLLIIPDHYVFRMLYSRGVAMEDLGIPRRDGAPVERDHRQIWQRFADHWYLFQGTPTGVWIRDELRDVFGIDERLTPQSAQSIYDAVARQLAAPAFRPRALFERFNISVLCTTDAATDPLTHHRAIRESSWGGVVRPTFRPDAVVNLGTPGWAAQIEALSAVSGVPISGYRSYIAALEQRRSFFQQLGATATDHAALTPFTCTLSEVEADAIFQRALRGDASAEDAAQFTGHMLTEMARMSVEDGLVMQLHVGSFRNHNERLFAAYGPDKGADIPVATEYTRNLWHLLGRYGNDPRLTLVLFTLDETSYSRELAPLAGHYPALRLGPPWWFFDSLGGMGRFFDSVVETAGIYNTAGFNDDTRAFCSIPVRHDLWRRAAADWVAGQVLRMTIDLEEAPRIMDALATGLARETYRL